jgi:hypothetical protein
MRESKAQREAFIEKFGEGGGDIGKFLQENYGLIVQKARKKFGDTFDIAEVMSDAAEAWHAMKRYHSKAKPTKHTTSYSWFLNRQLDISYRSGVVVDSHRHSKGCSESANGNGNSDTNEFFFDRASHRSYFGSDDEGRPGHEERLFYLSEELEEYGKVPDAADEGQECGKMKQARNASLSYVPRYVICMESFKKCLLSGDLRLLLKALSDRNTSLNRGRYEKLLASRRSINALSDHLRQQLFYETAKAGYDLYIAVCLNGSYNNVLVAAHSENEAQTYLARYGNLVEIRRLDIS